MPFLNRLAQSVKRGKYLRSFYDLFKKVVEINLFYLVREGCSGDDSFDIEPKISPCEIFLLKPTDLRDISNNEEVPQSEEELLGRLIEGCICIGIRHHDDIAAYMWCNLRKCDFIFLEFDLKNDEAYLMDARTFSSYRGKHLAPYLRKELYQHLRQIGRTKFYSITMYWNIPAQKFKEKLNAKPQVLFLWVKLLSDYKWAIPLKKYKIGKVL